MKRLIAILLAVMLMSFVLTACSGTAKTVVVIPGDSENTESGVISLFRTASSGKLLTALHPEHRINALGQSGDKLRGLTGKQIPKSISGLLRLFTAEGKHLPPTGKSRRLSAGNRAFSVRKRFTRKDPQSGIAVGIKEAIRFSFTQMHSSCS